MDDVQVTEAIDVKALKVGNLRWHLVDPMSPDGPRMAALWGDPGTSAYGALLRVPGGFESPLHRHSRDEQVVMLSGTSIHWTEAGSRDTAQRLTAGDYLLMPAGVNHVSAAAEGEDVLELIAQDGPFDFAMASRGDGVARR